MKIEVKQKHIDMAPKLFSKGVNAKECCPISCAIQEKFPDKLVSVGWCNEVDNYKIKDFDFAQKHLRILSGLYGILRPLDLIQPYRLEMATKLPTARGKDLYAFWGNRINQSLNTELKREKSGVLINLASVEYFKAAEAGLLNATVITPVFKELRDASYRVVAIYAKKARGLMCNYIIRNHLTRARDLQSFDLNGYRFNPKLSSQKQWVFTRGDESRE